MKYFFDKYGFTSGGALAALTLGLCVKELWRRRLPSFLSSEVRRAARPAASAADRLRVRSPALCSRGAPPLLLTHDTQRSHFFVPALKCLEVLLLGTRRESIKPLRVAAQDDEPLENIRLAEKHVPALNPRGFGSRVWARVTEPLRVAAQDDEPLENIRLAEKHVRFLWRWLLMPLLFCLIGTAINFDTLPSSVIAKAVGLICAGEPWALNPARGLAPSPSAAQCMLPALTTHGEIP